MKVLNENRNQLVSYAYIDTINTLKIFQLLSEKEIREECGFSREIKEEPKSLKLSDLQKRLEVGILPEQ